jgi:hypothetical protein
LRHQLALRRREGTMPLSHLDANAVLREYQDRAIDHMERAT